MSDPVSGREKRIEKGTSFVTMLQSWCLSAMKSE